MIPLSFHSYYSLQFGLYSPKEIALQVKALDLPGAALTDINSLSGVVQFVQEMKNVNKKAILGCDLEVGNDRITLLAKNLTGWKNLLYLFSQFEKKDGVYRLTLEHIQCFADVNNLICIVEHCNDFELWEQMFKHIYLGITQVHKHENIETDKKVAFPKLFYFNDEDYIYQRILLCNYLKATFASYKEHIIKQQKYDTLQYFEHTNYYYDKFMYSGMPEAVKKTYEIFDMCESYDILKKPEIPVIDCGNQTQNEKLRQLCREGWKYKIQGRIKNTKPYEERIKYELKVVEEVGLAGYFLIVADILDYIKKNGWLAGPGRGSAAGSLISYLTNITQVDPIKYGLLFSRFYNEGRVTKDKISLPDIDIDVPKDKRETIIEYIKSKYGHEHVAQICTFGSIKGSGALKAVFRAYGGINAVDQNNITKHIPQEAKIAGDLQLMKEAGEEVSIIRWALINNRKKLEQWCFIDDDGNLQGPLAKRFEQAINLEKIKVTLSKHAAGLVIGNRPLVEMCPLIRDKNDKLMSGLEMEDLEAIGLMKLDILGMAVFTKIQKFKDILSTIGIDEYEVC